MIEIDRPGDSDELAGGEGDQNSEAVDLTGSDENQVTDGDGNYTGGGNG